MQRALIDSPIRKLAVAVSGGEDSMVLTHLLSDFCADHAIELFCISVDHKLRQESTRELQELHHYLDKRKLNHTILTWQHEKITSALQQKARQARYQLIKEWCLANDITVCCIAHHAQDQFETFMMRLAKGSGVRGLCVMQENTDLGQSIRLLRPLLHVKKDAIHAYAEHHNLPIWQDPSNTNQQFTRVHVRSHQEVLDKLGLNANSVSRTIENMREVQHFIDSQVLSALPALEITHVSGALTCNLDALLGLNDFIMREVLHYFILEFGHTFVKKESLREFAFNIRGSQKTFTLANLLWQKKQSRLIVSRENRANNDS